MNTGISSADRAGPDEACGLAPKMFSRRKFLALAAAGLASRELPARLPPPPPPLTLEDKVRLAEFIFVGLARRVFYVDPTYREISDDPEGLTSHSSVLAVRILETLFPNRMNMTSIDISSVAPRGGAGGVRQKYVEKLFIYFVTRHEVNYPERKYVYVYARGPSWDATPESFEKRDEVIALIRDTGKTGPESIEGFYRRRGRP